MATDTNALFERAKHAAVAIGLAVILPMLLYYGVATFEPPPERETYVTAMPKPIETTDEAERARQLEEQRARMEQEMKAFDVARQDFSRTLFFVAAPLGILAILVGGFITVPAVGTGLILGGVANLVMGYGQYWDHLEHWMRFVSLLVAFVVLIAVAWQRFRRPGSKTSSEAN